VLSNKTVQVRDDEHNIAGLYAINEKYLLLANVFSVGTFNWREFTVLNYDTIKAKMSVLRIILLFLCFQPQPHLSWLSG
jgi:hypothetical protein